MGIPSYYKTLITKYKHAITRQTPVGTAALVIDMNCMIYHVLREPTMEACVYPGSEDSAGCAKWERKLQEEVCTYLTFIWRAAGAPLKMLVALDGVVPYAKIKQQRFRRFKSASLSLNQTKSWDTNAITPGTDFMQAMGNALREVGSKHHWQISDTNEPGEGEHKVLNWIRSQTSLSGPVVVYGLDADLILLSMLAGEYLGPGSPVYLMRESMAFGKLVRIPENKQVELCFLQISILLQSLQNGQVWSREELYDYIFGMSFCGNDFLPTGLSLRMRDEGHSILLDCLRTLWKRSIHLVNFDTDGKASLNKDGLYQFTCWMAQQEERLITKMIDRKMKSPFGENDADNIALKEQAELPLLMQGTDANNRIHLQPQWKSQYYRIGFGESSVDVRKHWVSQYWKGFQWIFDYYLGSAVDQEFVYAAGYPPTWCDLRDFFVFDKINWSVRPILQPKEQLALVLPLASWNLLLKTPFRSLPHRLPQYWPASFHLETFGKRFGWECEPMIPMLTPERLRYEVSRMNTKV